MSDEGWEKSYHVSFTVKYNGRAVESHEMNVNDLAKSLLGISGVLEQTTRVINGKNSNIFVKIKGSFKPGSFDVYIVTLLTCTGIQAVLNIVNIVGFVGDSVQSLIWLYKQTKGEPVESVEHVDSNNVKLTFKNCSDLTVNMYIADAYQNDAIKKELRNMVLPLENDDMSDIAFLKDGIEQEKITRNEKDIFYSSDTEPIVNEGTDYFLITQSNFFGKRTGWKLAFVNPSDIKPDLKDFSVKMLDDSFLKNVRNQNIIISNEGTIIKARYRKTIKEDGVIWEIPDVFDHKSILKKEDKKIKHLDDF